MADTSVRLVDQGSHEVAFKLMKEVMLSESVSLTGGPTTKQADRAYLLTLYYECQRVVVGGIQPGR